LWHWMVKLFEWDKSFAKYKYLASMQNPVLLQISYNGCCPI